MDTERQTIYLCLAHMSEAGLEQKYVKEAFDTNWVVPMGPNVNAFEHDLEAFANSKSNGTTPLDRKVVCLSAGTAAVHLALIGCGVKAGDEVLVQSFILRLEPPRHLPWRQARVCRLRGRNLEHGPRPARKGHHRPPTKDWQTAQGHCARGTLRHALPH